jgi:preprotein translocase subunit SecF
MRLPIIKLRWLWYSISLCIVGVGIVSVAAFGLRVGIDFQGGTLMSVTWEGERPSVSSVEEIFHSAGIENVVIQPVAEQEHIYRFLLIDEDIHRSLSSALAERGEIREDRYEMVGPAIGKELQKKSMWSIILVILAVTAYVAWVFRHVSRPVSSWKYGVITIIALIHDVFLPIGLFAILGHFFNVEITSAFVVALLTTLGYSVNDTIVVFDRTRENITKIGTQTTFEDVVNTSVNQTLARSINTSLTTLLVLTAVFLYGGASIQYFALALMAGVVAGTYSSIFLASPLLVSWYNWGRR